MKTLLAALLSALLAFAGPVALADETTQATRRAQGDALIAGAGAADLFVNETVDEKGAILIRHKASNFQCVFEPDRQNSLQLFTQSLPRGDDIGCTTPTTLFLMSFFVTRTSETLDEDFGAALQALQAHMPGLREVRVKPSDYGEGMVKLASYIPAPVRTVIFTGKVEGEMVVTRLSVVHIGEWSVTMRATGPADAFSASRGLMELMWVTRVLVMTVPLDTPAQAAGDKS